MWSARRRPARGSGPAPRTNDIDTDERRQTIPRRGRPTTNRPQGVDKRCLIGDQERQPVQEGFDVATSQRVRRVTAIRTGRTQALGRAAKLTR